MTNRAPILGQEAVVRTYGLGRVTKLDSRTNPRFIGVTPYVAGYEMEFAPENVILVALNMEPK